MRNDLRAFPFFNRDAQVSVNKSWMLYENIKLELNGYSWNIKKEKCWGKCSIYGDGVEKIISIFSL